MQKNAPSSTISTGRFLYQLDKPQDKRELVVVGNAIDDQPMISQPYGPLV